MRNMSILFVGLLNLAVAAALSAQPTITTLHNFTNTAGDGANPRTSVTIGPGGVLYGVTLSGGTFGQGTIFSLKPPASPGGSWTETLLYEFTDGSDGGGPISRLATGAGPGGAVVLYGTTTFSAGTPFGSVYSLTAPATTGGPWTFATLFTFAGINGAGGYPVGGITIGPGGVLYGAAQYGGTGCPNVYPNFGCGEVYSLTPPAAPGGAWTQTILHSFLFTEGYGPQSPIVIGPGGVLYGTAIHGGDLSACPTNKSGCGTVYSLTPPATPGGSWTLSVLYSFSNGADGIFPSAVVLGANGIIYGSTYQNVFSLTPPASPGDSWTETVVQTFSSELEGPLVSLVIGSNGTLFGATPGGAADAGTIFSLTPPASSGGVWTNNQMVRFSPTTNGTKPQGLTLGVSGGRAVLYGTTEFGLTTLFNDGTVFALQP